MNDLESGNSGKSNRVTIEDTPSIDLETARNKLQTVVDFDESLLSEGQLDNIGNFSAAELGKAVALICGDLMSRKQAEWDDQLLDKSSKYGSLTKAAGKGSLHMELSYESDNGTDWTARSVDMHYRSYTNKEDIFPGYPDLVAASLRRFIDALETSRDGIDPLEVGKGDLPLNPQKVYGKFRETDAIYRFDPSIEYGQKAGFRDGIYKITDNGDEPERVEDADLWAVYHEKTEGEIPDGIGSFNMDKYRIVFRGARWIFANLLNWDGDYISPDDLPRSAKPIEARTSPLLTDKTK